LNVSLLKQWGECGGEKIPEYTMAIGDKKVKIGYYSV
jgi:hypothetical protein